MIEAREGPGEGRPRGFRRVARAAAVLAALILLGVAVNRMGLFGPGAPAEMEAEAQQEMPPMPVDVALARLDTVTDAIHVTGRIEAVHAIELRPDEPGRITALAFEEGQWVDAGTPLVRIDDAMLRAAAERAAADRDLAVQQLERERRLRDQNASAAADLERAEAAARSTAASLALLELQVERSTVRAPFSGMVGQRFVSLGDRVDEGTRLLSLHTVDPQLAVIQVPERHAGSLREGQDVRFTIAAHPDREFEATVDFIDPIVEPGARTILVKARAPNAERLLRPGMFIDARVMTATRADAVVVPEDAVQPLRTGNVAWVVSGGVAHRRVVELGARAPGAVEILSGVVAGDTVVVGGLERMGEGLPVAPRAPGSEGGRG